MTFLYHSTPRMLIQQAFMDTLRHSFSHMTDTHWLSLASQWLVPIFCIFITLAVMVHYLYIWLFNYLLERQQQLHPGAILMHSPKQPRVAALVRAVMARTLHYLCKLFEFLLIHGGKLGNFVYRLSCKSYRVMRVAWEWMQRLGVRLIHCVRDKVQQRKRRDERSDANPSDKSPSKASSRASHPVAATAAVRRVAFAESDSGRMRDTVVYFDTAAPATQMSSPQDRVRNVGETPSRQNRKVHRVQTPPAKVKRNDGIENLMSEHRQQHVNNSDNSSSKGSSTRSTSNGYRATNAGTPQRNESRAADQPKDITQQSSHQFRSTTANQQSSTHRPPAKPVTTALVRTKVHETLRERFDRKRQLELTDGTAEGQQQQLTQEPVLKRGRLPLTARSVQPLHVTSPAARKRMYQQRFEHVYEQLNKKPKSSSTADAGASNVPLNAMNNATTISFGSAAASNNTTPATAPDSSSNQAPEASIAPSTAQPFTFGAAAATTTLTTPSTAPGNLSNQAPQASTASSIAQPFTFGAAAATTTLTQNGVVPNAAPGTTTPAPQPASEFGSANTAPANAAQPNMLETAAAMPASTMTQNGSGLIAPPGATTPAPPPIAAFGSANAAPANAAQPVTFGTAAATPATSTQNGRGSNVAPGTTTPASQPATAFGSAVTNGTPSAPQPAFLFGSTAENTPAPGPVSAPVPAGFLFTAPSSAPPFANTNTATQTSQSTVPINGFGASTPAAAASASQASTGAPFAFGSVAPASMFGALGASATPTIAPSDSQPTAIQAAAVTTPSSAAPTFENASSMFSKIVPASDHILTSQNAMNQSTGTDIFSSGSHAFKFGDGANGLTTTPTSNVSGSDSAPSNGFASSTAAPMSFGLSAGTNATSFNAPAAQSFPSAQGFTQPASSFSSNNSNPVFASTPAQGPSTNSFSTALNSTPNASFENNNGLAGPSVGPFSTPTAGTTTAPFGTMTAPVMNSVTTPSYSGATPSTFAAPATASSFGNQGPASMFDSAASSGGFGVAVAQASNPMFGSSGQVTAPSSGGFGGNGAQASNPMFGQVTAPSSGGFGATGASTSNPMFGSSSQATAPSFGATSFGIAPAAGGFGISGSAATVNGGVAAAARTSRGNAALRKKMGANRRR
ncbi:hypothetical protein MPSEU_000579400 [Mayamaea pseudoterrestris]|nr:hypothetical protein MPSEU_000579400 [Mayamaea pseudoterrestris]